MGLESGSFISSLVATWPLDSDLESQGAAHLRLIKSVLQNTLPGATAAMGPSTAVPLVDGTAAVGVSVSWARGDHVHPTDTTRYAASNPSGFQTAAQVSASLGPYWTAAQVQAQGYQTITNPAIFSTSALQVRAPSGNITELLLYDSAGNQRSQHYWDAGNNSTVITDIVAGSNLILDSAGNVNANPGGTGNFIVHAGKGFQPGGGTWGVLSDERIKTIIGEYIGGLAEIVRLQPISYVYKGNDSIEPPTGEAPYRASWHQRAALDGKLYVGLVAQELEKVFPSMVSVRKGYIDGEPVSDLREMDTSELIYALVNAVKELAAEVAMLKEAKSV